MRDILADLSDTKLVKTVIKANWENYHYCLGRSPSVELSVGRYLTWFVTNMPDHFMNLVVCTELPSEGIDNLIKDALTHFRILNIKKLSWLIQEQVPPNEIKKQLEAHGLTFRESFATEMAADLRNLSEKPAVPDGLQITAVENEEMLRQWIHVASIGFGIPHDVENIWYEFFAEAACERPFRTYLAFLNNQPVGTSQLFTSAGVAGIYNVTCLPEARGQGIGAAITLAPLFEAREMGYRVGILQASSMGYRVYKRLGFQDFGKLSVYLWEQ
ncbi:MAG TPA: GNAT family N-acetyltransferase [Anaerolineales bacterium]|nr:GNAT family N-acetyltransferase [Anaerolineales bacterium]